MMQEENENIKNNRELLRKALADRKLTFREASVVSGIHLATLNHIVRGRRKPSGEVAVRLEDTFGIPQRNWFTEQAPISA